MNGIFDLVHRAMMGGNRSLDDFSNEQQGNLNDAAAQFRALQQQRLKNQQQTPAATPEAPAASTPSPATTTPAN